MCVPFVYNLSTPLVNDLIFKAKVISEKERKKKRKEKKENTLWNLSPLNHLDHVRKVDPFIKVPLSLTCYKEWTGGQAIIT